MLLFKKMDNLSVSRKWRRRKRRRLKEGKHEGCQLVFVCVGIGGS